MKVVLMGFVAGRTSMINRFCGYMLENEIIRATTAVNFAMKPMVIDRTPIELRIWDCTGCELCVPMYRVYLRGTAAVMFVYDITRNTFDQVDQYVELCGELKVNVPFVLAGNKLDTADHRQVSEEEGRQKAASLGASFFETSARSGENIDKCFGALALAGFRHSLAGSIHAPEPQTPPENQPPDKQSTRSCVVC